MSNFMKFSVFATGLLASTALSNAADLIEPPVVEMVPEVRTVYTGGWYLRGDIGYSHMKVEGVDYYQGTPTLTGSFDKHDLGDSWMLGGGIGYQVNDYFRVDLTVDHHFHADFNGVSARNATCSVVVAAGTCSYDDDAKLGVTTLMANAYMDLGKYSGFTPYVGAGLGGAMVHWGDLKNTEYEDADPTNSATSTHDGNGEWRFAYALHAGVSYDLTSNLKLDTGYTYKHIEGGNMFSFESGNANSGPQGFDGDIEIHTVRAGLRWSLH